MKHAKETIFTQFRCTRRVVLTFPHFITETGKQIITYHQGSAVNTTLKVSFCFSFKVLNDSEESVSRSVLLSTYMMLERFGDNLTVTNPNISKLNTMSLCCCTIHWWCTRRNNCSNLCYPTEGWTKVLAQKGKDGSVANTLFHITLTFHITLFKLSCFFLNNVYSYLEIDSPFQIFSVGLLVEFID